MAEIKLAGGSVAIIDDSDAEFLAQWRWQLQTRGGRYARRSVRHDGKSSTVYMHRVIASPPPGSLVDHVNGNTLDNRRFNLRITDRSGVQQNQARAALQGVSYVKATNKWLAVLRYDRRRYHLGYFDDPRVAQQVRNFVRNGLMGEPTGRPSFDLLLLTPSVRKLVHSFLKGAI
jgi:hypothetical protein